MGKEQINWQKCDLFVEFWALFITVGGGGGGQKTVGVVEGIMSLPPLPPRLISYYAPVYEDSGFCVEDSVGGESSSRFVSTSKSSGCANPRFLYKMVAQETLCMRFKK